MRIPHPFGVFVGICIAGILSAPAKACEITVSAAASLSNALPEIARLYQASMPPNPCRIQFNFGASGALLQQIIKGAPVDIFASADQLSMDALQSKSALAWRFDFAANQLVLVVPKGSAAELALKNKLPASLQALRDPVFARIAIGQPAFVPVGRYAKASMQDAGVWAGLENKFIMANHVRQVLDYVARAEVDAGIVYRSDAQLMPEKVSVGFSLPSQQTILYPIALLRSSQQAQAARGFMQFLRRPEAQAVLRQYGFSTPSNAKP